jgi:hypothetical protein
VVLVLFAIVVAWGLLALAKDDNNLRKSGEPARAQVLVVQPAGKSLVLHDAEIRFRTRDGAMVRSLVAVEDALKPVRKGDIVEIRFNPRHPTERAVLDRINTASHWRNATIPFSAAVFLPLVFAVSLVGFQPKKANSASQ